MRQGLLPLAGTIKVGPAETILSPGEVGIDRDRGLFIANYHFDLAGEDMRPPQGEMRHWFVRIERYRVFGRRSRRRHGFCSIIGVAVKHRRRESKSELSMSHREFLVQRDRFPE